MYLSKQRALWKRPNFVFDILVGFSVEMAQHQLQLESWDNWDIVYENLIIKHKSSAGFTFLCKYAALY